MHKWIELELKRKKSRRNKEQTKGHPVNASASAPVSNFSGNYVSLSGVSLPALFCTFLCVFYKRESGHQHRRLEERQNFPKKFPLDEQKFVWTLKLFFGRVKVRSEAQFGQEPNFIFLGLLSLIYGLGFFCVWWNMYAGLLFHYL